ncbi:DUF354 domain-containing protein [Crocinitomix sp.]|nr:DUF354 domain-containing protein [Crocinitomix sp.]
MKILIDIGHPAHVHYFRHFIEKMKSDNHEIMVTARDKDVTIQLLNEYKIKYYNRGKGKNGLIAKILYMIWADIKLLKLTRKFKADAYLSFASPYAAQVAWLRGKPHVAFDDTEHAKIARKFYLPFSKYVYTPYCFELDLGKKHHRFNSFMELAYLHPAVFKPLAINHPDIPKEKYVFLRFIAWTANHDVGQSGLDLETKREIINRLKKDYRILISSEGDFPEEFKKFQIKISPISIHSVLKNAELFIGEGATMAVESAFLGTPSIYVNSLNAGTLNEINRMGLMKSFRNTTGVIQCLDDFLENKNKWTDQSKNTIERVEKLDNPTDLLIQIFNSLS